LTAAEADIALARGAAVSAGRAVNGPDAPAGRRWRLSRTSLVASVFAAAVVTFVVSLSVALGLSLTPDSNEPTQNANAAAQQQDKKPAAPQSMLKAAPPAPKVAAPAPVETPLAPPPVVETLAAAVPAPPEAVPAYEPPAYVPPAPAYVPPAVPAYVPPPVPAYVPPAAPPAYVPPPAPAVPPVQQGTPRVRDKIIEKIPLINRFHEPQMQYPD
jgi:hypothetical protein